ncbi:toxin-antitoxin system HicB family antitoxin, partial [candidate division WOR-3 bacterium]|nr:toxin-antitoxin system HicB family antitoxin [candidate division WOR-3 bacterium]
PLPKVMEEYSGKFVLRVPKSLHGKLSNLAEKEGVSLNQMVVSLLSERFAFRRVENKIQSLSWGMQEVQIGLYDLKQPAPLSDEARRIRASLHKEVKLPCKIYEYGEVS